jgi:hypothetical protein
MRGPARCFTLPAAGSIQAKPRRSAAMKPPPSHSAKLPISSGTRHDFVSPDLKS